MTKCNESCSFRLKALTQTEQTNGLYIKHEIIRLKWPSRINMMIYISVQYMFKQTNIPVFVVRLLMACEVIFAFKGSIAHIADKSMGEN